MTTPQHRRRHHAPQHRRKPHVPQHRLRSAPPIRPTPPVGLTPTICTTPSVKALGPSWKALRILVAVASGVTTVGTVAETTSAVPAWASLQDSSQPTYYTVRDGDTLGAIASRTGTSVAALTTMNSLTNPNVIFVGQRLVVGQRVVVSRPPTATPAAPRHYTVRAGDTLGSIAAQLGTTVSALATDNHIADPNLIVIGQVLSLSPTATRTTILTTTPTTTPTTRRSSPPAQLIAHRSYTVRAGDTLATIAAQLGTNVSALAAANHISDPNLIVVGQVLSLDGASTPSPTKPSIASIAVHVALQQVGKPYVFAGAGPSNFDCSGLVTYAYAAAGVSLEHYTVAQYQGTTPISQEQLQPGDLVFYDTGSGAQPGHVAIYIGSGNVVASNHAGTNVQTQPLDWDGTIMGFRRVK